MNSVVSSIELLKPKIGDVIVVKVDRDRIHRAEIQSLAKQLNQVLPRFVKAIIIPTDMEIVQLSEETLAKSGLMKIPSPSSAPCVDSPSVPSTGKSPLAQTETGSAEQNQTGDSV